MKITSRPMPPRSSIATLDATALGRVRGGLVSNFNRLTLPPTSLTDGTPGSVAEPGAATSGGPLESW